MTFMTTPARCESSRSWGSWGRESRILRVRQSTRRSPRGAGIPPTGFTQVTAYVAGGGEGPGGLRLLLLFVLACLNLLGCEDVKYQYMPLAVGNRWTYRVVSDDRQLGTESLTVVEELSSKLVDDDTYRRFRMREPEATTVWSEDTGTVMRSSGRSFVTVIQYPPFVGSGWTDTALNGAPVFCKVLRRDYVKTPAGYFFECIIIEREAEDLSSRVTQWFAPDIGLVKWRVERPGRSPVEWQLLSFDRIR